MSKICQITGKKVMVGNNVSHAKNRKYVLRILESGAKVEYFDHHDPSELIDHPNIIYHIDIIIRVQRLYIIYYI